MIEQQRSRSGPSGDVHLGRQVHVMGTVVVIDLFADVGAPTPELSRLLDAAEGELHRLDELFSTWKYRSPMNRVRRGELEIAEAPAEIAEVLRLCSIAKQQTGGWFDPWALPGGVDPTGYVKGWAAEQALGALRAPFVNGAIVNAAGDIASFGSTAGTSGGPGFRFGIVDPFDRCRLACVVSGTSALATSGSYERGLHLVDPRTGDQVTRVASASVSGPRLGTADALATAVAVSGADGLEAVEAIDGYEAMIVTLEGSMCWSAGFPFAAPDDPFRNVC